MKHILGKRFEHIKAITGIRGVRKQSVRWHGTCLRCRLTEPKLGGGGQARSSPKSARTTKQEKAPSPGAVSGPPDRAELEEDCIPAEGPAQGRGPGASLHPQVCVPQLREQTCDDRLLKAVC